MHQDVQPAEDRGGLADDGFGRSAGGDVTGLGGDVTPCAAKFRRSLLHHVGVDVD